MSEKTINVHIGEVHVARRGETLTAILGSCVGIGLLWKERKICGLAHSLLPEDMNPKFVVGGRYASQAVKSLFIKLRITPERYSELEAVIVGGGNLTGKDLSALQHIGTMNLAVAERELKAAGIHIAKIERGGIDGRRITIDSAACTYRISKIPRIAGAS